MTNQVEFFVKRRELLHSLRHASHHNLFVGNNVLLSRIAYVVFVASSMRSLITLLQTLQLSFPCVLHAILSSENCYSSKITFHYMELTYNATYSLNFAFVPLCYNASPNI